MFIHKAGPLFNEVANTDLSILVYEGGAKSPASRVAGISGILHKIYESKSMITDIAVLFDGGSTGALQVISKNIAKNTNELWKSICTLNSKNGKGQKLLRNIKIHGGLVFSNIHTKCLHFFVILGLPIILGGPRNVNDLFIQPQTPMKTHLRWKRFKRCISSKQQLGLLVVCRLSS